MGAFLIPLIGGAIGGAVAARLMFRREVELLREALKERAAAPPPSSAPVERAAVETAPMAPPAQEPVAAQAVPVSAPPPPAAPQPAAAAPEISPGITPEILMVLSAAVAAFLGKKAKIRRARLAGPMSSGSAWAQQGRVFVQASHNLVR
jgi:methylmalonyl-CoA carboxyltransferase large subunit